MKNMMLPKNLAERCNSLAYKRGFIDPWTQKELESELLAFAEACYTAGAKDMQETIIENIKAGMTFARE